MAKAWDGDAGFAAERCCNQSQQQWVERSRRLLKLGLNKAESGGFGGSEILVVLCSQDETALPTQADQARQFGRGKRQSDLDKAA